MSATGFREHPGLFWAKLDKSGDCWLWTGCRSKTGYGRAGKRDYAHRLAAEFTYGPCPEGLEVRHLCGVRACCNPAHLRYGTHSENAADSIEHGTHYSPFTAEGRARHEIPAWNAGAASDRCGRGHDPSEVYRRKAGPREGQFVYCRACRRERRTGCKP